MGCEVSIRLLVDGEDTTMFEMSRVLLLLDVDVAFVTDADDVGLSCS